MALCVTASALAGASAPGHMLGGHAHGGYGPLVGSTVTLYSVGTTGYGSAATSLGSTVTDASGNFNLPVTCPGNNPLTYLTATGGKSGGGTVANSGIGLILGTGACASIPATVIINEVSTVATVYALARFTDATTLDIGAPSSNTVGITNAFTLIGSLYNPTTGMTGPLYGQPGIPPVSVQKFNTLADILVSCVNSSSPFAACASLFTAATPPSGPAPTNTDQALFDIAQNPGNNVAAIYAQLALVNGPLPFTPTLATAPNQWFLGIFHGLGPNAQPEELAVDASGNLYVADHGGSTGTGGVIRLTPSGSHTEFSVDASAPFGVAVASDGGIWITNDTNGTLVEYSSTGTVMAGPVTGLRSPRTVAVDQTGNVWVANTGGNSVLEFSSTGSLLNTITHPSILAPFDIAVDASGHVWSANEASASISMIAGTTVSSFTRNGVNLPKGIVADALGTIWVGNYDASTRISAFTSVGAPIGNFLVGGTGRVLRLATDSADNLWASDVDTHALTELSPGGVAISPAAGYISRALNEAPQSIAIDPSGNIFVSDLENNGVTEYVGAAPPVKTPLIGPALLP